MSEDKPGQDNIISFDFRRKGKTGAEKPAGAAGGAHNEDKDGGPEGDAAKTGQQSLPAMGDGMGSYPGSLTWLHCPTCNTLEYTEVAMAGGRVHNVCGGTVEEAKMPLDLRAEVTNADINLERLEIFEKVIQGRRAHFEEYRKRVRLAAGQNLEGYPSGDVARKKLEQGTMDDFGLVVPEFFSAAAALFKGRKEKGPQGAEDGVDKGAPSARLTVAPDPAPDLAPSATPTSTPPAGDDSGEPPEST